MRVCKIIVNHPTLVIYLISLLKNIPICSIRKIKVFRLLAQIVIDFKPFIMFKIVIVTKRKTWFI